MANVAKIKQIEVRQLAERLAACTAVKIKNKMVNSCTSSGYHLSVQHEAGRDSR